MLSTPPDTVPIPRISHPARLPWWLTDLLPARWYPRIVGLVAFILTAWHAGVPGLWFDETFSVGLAAQPVAVMAHFLWGGENQMTLYYLLLHGWLDVLTTFGAGDSAFLVRLPSLVCAALAAVVLYCLGARWWSRTTGLVAAIVFASCPLLLRQAQEARGYVLQVLLQTLAWYCFFAALDAAPDRSRRWCWWAAFVGMLTLAVYAHIDTTVCAVAFPVALVALAYTPVSSAFSPQWQRWRTNARASVRAFLLASVAVLLACAPLGLDAALHGGRNGWVPAASWARLVLMVHDNLLAGVGWLGWLLLGAALLALLPAVAWRQRTVLRPLMPLTLAVLAWLLVPLVLFTVLPLHLFHWRYLVVVVPPLALLAGIGVTRLRAYSLRIGLAVVFSVVLLVLFPPAYYATTRDDYRTPAAWLSARLQPGDGVVCWPDIICAVPMSYYVPQLAHATYPGGWDWMQSIPASGPSLTAYLAHHDRVWLVLAPHGATSPGAEQAERVAVQAAGFTAAPGIHLYVDTARIILYTRQPHTLRYQTRLTPPVPLGTHTPATFATPLPVPYKMALMLATPVPVP